MFSTKQLGLSEIRGMFVLNVEMMHLCLYPIVGNELNVKSIKRFKIVFYQLIHHVSLSHVNLMSSNAEKQTSV